MTSIRKQVADKITADFLAAGVAADVYPFGYVPDELRRPAVAVFRETVGQEVASLDHALVIQIFSPLAYSTEDAEDVLDTLLDEALLALRRLAVVTFKEAKRQVLAEQFQGWEITASWASADYIKANAY